MVLREIVARQNVAQQNVVQQNVAQQNVTRQNVTCYKSDKMSPTAKCRLLQYQTPLMSPRCQCRRYPDDFFMHLTNVADIRTIFSCTVKMQNEKIELTTPNLTRG
jgi:hypothetical protein